MRKVALPRHVPGLPAPYAMRAIGVIDRVVAWVYAEQALPVECGVASFMLRCRPPIGAAKATVAMLVPGLLLDHVVLSLGRVLQLVEPTVRVHHMDLGAEDLMCTRRLTNLRLSDDLPSDDVTVGARRPIIRGDRGAAPAILRRALVGRGHGVGGGGVYKHP